MPSLKTSLLADPSLHPSPASDQASSAASSLARSLARSAAVGLLLALPVSALALGNTAPTHHPLHHASPALHHLSTTSHHHTTHPVTRRAIAAMPTERATQIQTALIQKGYLSGPATGVWDTQSVAAMQKLQGDHGWQTKMTPDSRALIVLGLGPQSDEQATSTHP